MYVTPDASFNRPHNAIGVWYWKLNKPAQPDNEPYKYMPHPVYVLYMMPSSLGVGGSKTFRSAQKASEFIEELRSKYDAKIIYPA